MKLAAAMQLEGAKRSFKFLQESRSGNGHLY